MLIGISTRRVKSTKSYKRPYLGKKETCNIHLNNDRTFVPQLSACNHIAQCQDGNLLFLNQNGCMYTLAIGTLENLFQYSNKKENSNQF